MKIAHVASQLDRASAGLGAAIAAISAATQTAGNEVRVFGLSSADWVARDGGAWTGAPATMLEPAAWSGPLGYAPAMLPALLDFDADVIHLHGLWTYPSIAAYRFHRKSGRPLVVSAHGMLMPVALTYSRGRKRIARVLFQDRVLRAASFFHSTSRDEEAAYRALGLDTPVGLIPLGMDLLPRPEDLPEVPGRKLLFLGRLHPLKGIDWLIEAWMRLQADYPDWELSIVGPTDPSYAREIARFNREVAGSRVTFAGPRHDREKLRTMAGADLFVLPSRSENFGLTAAEALMMEVPVIATRGTPWSGLTEAGAGWWIEPGADALEQALRTAMRLPEAELQRMGRNGRQWIERDFSWPVIGRKWQAVYENLVAAGDR
ncbi:MAG: glycosyltransferase [Maritimibacter sp.]|nr:glycosyltransferase [Maritimibacter sp.]